jgi:hypothetical protein
MYMLPDTWQCVPCQVCSDHSFLHTETTFVLGVPSSACVLHYMSDAGLSSARLTIP